MKKKFFLVLLIAYSLFTGCKSNQILNSRLSLTPEEQQQLNERTNRLSNNEVYESSLDHIVRPNERTLLAEARLTANDSYTENYTVLADWYKNKISSHQKTQLSKNCSRLVGNFFDQFPLTPKTLPCAGWWLEQQAAARAQAQRQELDAKQKSQGSALSATARKKWTNYKHLEFSKASRSMSFNDFSEISALTHKALKTAQNCAYRNANIALMFKLEEYLPNPKAYSYIENIYEKSSHCYKPNEPLTERLNMRIGVLNLIQGKYTLAHNAFKKTQKEKEPQDKSRSLFWLGAIEHAKTKKTTNPYWEQLVQENPIGFFSLIANEKMNRDPMDTLVPDTAIEIQNRITGGWNENNLQAFLADLFIAKKDSQALKKLSQSVAKNSSGINKNLYLYWVVNHSFAKNDRASVTLLAGYFAAQKNPRISRQLLELNFPMRYATEIASVSTVMSPPLVLGVIRQESAFDSNAQSGANARGLMQLLPSTARMLNPHVTAKKLFEPKTNIEVGIAYLEKLNQKYSGQVEYILAAYNAGPNRVDIWTNRFAHMTPLLFMEYVPFQETRNYISAIMRNYYWYSRLQNEKPNHAFKSAQNEKAWLAQFEIL